MTDAPLPIEPSPGDQSVPLSKRGDLRLGDATVRPSLRTVEGPGGSFKGEPRVIQVLLALADAQGRVLSREDLLQLCWDGRIVGDDAINRAVAEVRRIATASQAGFEVETVSRVGYRLSGIDWSDQPIPAAVPGAQVDRRKLIVGGVAALGVAAAGGAVFLSRCRQNTIDALIERGRVLQADGNEQSKAKAAHLFRQAIDRDPERADAWGWLANIATDDETARGTATHALKLDRREPNARAVLALLRRDLDDWTRYEDELRSIVKDAPDCAAGWDQLTFFLQGMGRCRESRACNEQAIRIEPFNPSHHARRALKHWIFGRLDLADQVADSALQLWPRDSIVWNARMDIYAFSDRASAALAFLDDRASRPTDLTELAVSSWRATLEAISTRASRDIDQAIAINTAAAPRSPYFAANAIMALSYLGTLDAAYRVAEGLLTDSGPVVQQSRALIRRNLYAGPEWGRTQFLFIPATGPFRTDARFPELCQRMGHVAYWKRRGIWPDPFVRGAIDPAKLSHDA